MRKSMLRKRFVTYTELQELLKDPNLYFVPAWDERKDFQGYYATKGIWTNNKLILKESNTEEVFLIEEVTAP